MFIDGEQCGAYDVDNYMVEEKKHLLRNGKMEGEGYRNWKRLFTWAQQEAKLNLYFISSAWLNSPYCLGELADLIGIQYSESNYSSDDYSFSANFYAKEVETTPSTDGTPYDDTIIGTSGDDLIDPDSGNDIIKDFGEENIELLKMLLYPKQFHHLLI